MLGEWSHETVSQIDCLFILVRSNVLTTFPRGQVDPLWTHRLRGESWRFSMQNLGERFLLEKQHGKRPKEYSTHSKLPVSWSRKCFGNSSHLYYSILGLDFITSNYHPCLYQDRIVDEVSVVDDRFTKIAPLSLRPSTRYSIVECYMSTQSVLEYRLVIQDWE